MFEECVGRVVSTERCAKRGDRDAGRLAHGVDEGEDFAGHIGVVLRLHPAAMEGVRSLVGERITLHAVDGKESDAPLLDVGAERSDHALTFLLMLVAHAGGEGEDGRAVIAVNCDAHVAIETVRVPTLMVTMHAVRGYRVDGSPQARRDDGVSIRNRRNGFSEIEGKAARVAATELGQRRSFNAGRFFP